MSITFSTLAWEDYQYWAKHAKKKLDRINKLIRKSLKHPFEGLGKAESLKLNLQGFWSRRIGEEHRLIYAFEDGKLLIVVCKHHY